MTNPFNNRILCVDDDKSTLHLLCSLLKKWDLEPIPVSKGIDALKILSESTPPQLIITDWMMPEMTGSELTNKIRSTYPDKFLYIIILSSKSERQDIIEGLKSGANDYILKPFDSQELECRVKIGVNTVILQNKLSNKIIELNKALETIKTLEGLIPICMYCKKIRTPENYWQKIEEYIENHSDAKFTHGICNDCMKKIMSENQLKEKA